MQKARFRKVKEDLHINLLTCLPLWYIIGNENMIWEKECMNDCVQQKGINGAFVGDFSGFLFSKQ